MKHNVIFIIWCDSTQQTWCLCGSKRSMSRVSVVLYRLFAIYHSLTLSCFQRASRCCCALLAAAAAAVLVLDEHSHCEHVPAAQLCIFKRRDLTFILGCLSKAMGGYGREEGGCGAGLWNEVGCFMWRVHTQLTESRHRTAEAAPHTSKHTEGRAWPRRKKAERRRRRRRRRGWQLRHGHVRALLPASERRGAGLHPGLWKRQREV